MCAIAERFQAALAISVFGPLFYGEKRPTTGLTIKV